MKTQVGLSECLSFINCEIQPRAARLAEGRRFHSVTLSRQSGAGGHVIAEHLRELLQAHADPGACPWTIFDKNLVEKVLEEHNLPSRLARFMPEDRVSEISDTMDELFGLHPASWNLVRNVSETILRLADRGNVIIIGRGANVITAKLNTVLNVRLVGSMEKRLEHFQEERKVSRKIAMDLLRKEDRAHARYLRKYFDSDIQDPLLYHLVLNTDVISYTEAAEMVADLVLSPARPKLGIA